MDIDLNKLVDEAVKEQTLVNAAKLEAYEDFRAAIELALARLASVSGT